MYHTNNTSLPASKYENLSQSQTNIYEFLAQESKSNHQASWNKLDMTTKKHKLVDFAQIYGQENQYTPEKIQELVEFFQECLEKKKLHLVKEVLYNKETGIISKIPALCFNKTKQKFTLSQSLTTSLHTTKKASSTSTTNGGITTSHNKTLKTTKTPRKTTTTTITESNKIDTDTESSVD